PLRVKDTDLWIRLSPEDQQRALLVPGITPHRRFAGRGWGECEGVSSRAVGRAIRWLRRSYDTVKQQVERAERRTESRARRGGPAPRSGRRGAGGRAATPPRSWRWR